jgi:3-oxoadipate enol-lactonase
MNAAGIAWEARGPQDAPAIVLVHSLGSSRSAWAPQVVALQDRYRLVLVDLRGHGASPSPPGPYAIAELAQDVITATASAGAAQFHLCGISIGGLVALWTAAHRPEVVRSIIAANTAARIGTVERWTARIDAIRAGGMESIYDAVVGLWFSPDFADTHPDWHASARDGFLATDPEGYIGCCRALAAADLRSDVESITVPSLVIGGSLDAATPPAEAEWLGDAIAGSRLALIDGAAHLSNLDRPVEFTAHLAGFVDDVEAGR